MHLINYKLEDVQLSDRLFLIERSDQKCFVAEK